MADINSQQIIEYTKSQNGSILKTFNEDINTIDLEICNTICIHLYKIEILKDILIYKWKKTTTTTTQKTEMYTTNTNLMVFQWKTAD